MAYDPVHDEILVPSFYAFAILTFRGDANGNGGPVATDGGGGRRVPAIRIFDRMANGNAKPLRVISGSSAREAWLMTTYPEKGIIFAVVRPGNTGGLEGDISGRYQLDDYVGVWSIFDEGDVAPRFTIGGPNVLLKDARGIAVDPKSKDVMVSDKTLNAVFRFHVPEAC